MTAPIRHTVTTATRPRARSIAPTAAKWRMTDHEEGKHASKRGRDVDDDVGDEEDDDDDKYRRGGRAEGGKTDDDLHGEGREAARKGVNRNTYSDRAQRRTW